MCYRNIFIHIHIYVFGKTHLSKTTCVQGAEVSLTECLKTVGTVCLHLYKVRVSTLVWIIITNNQSKLDITVEMRFTHYKNCIAGLWRASAKLASAAQWNCVQMICYKVNISTIDQNKMSWGGKSV